MSSRNRNNNTRNKGRGRGGRKEPKKADPNAQATPLETPDLLSPSLASQLPLDNQNKSPRVTVSTSSPFSDETQSTESKDSTSNDNISTLQHVSYGLGEGDDSQILNHDGGASPEVSDNTAPAIVSSPTPQPQLSDSMLLLPPPFPPQSSVKEDDPFRSNPEDPWHFTFTELRAMRKRMLTLDKLESTTQNISQQLQAINSQTSNLKNQADSNSQQIEELKSKVSASDGKAKKMETQVDGNSHQIKKLGEEITALKKVVQEQQQTISILTEIKNEFKQDKDDFSKKSRKAVTEMNKLVDAQRAG